MESDVNSSVIKMITILYILLIDIILPSVSLNQAPLNSPAGVVIVAILSTIFMPGISTSSNMTPFAFSLR